MIRAKSKSGLPRIPKVVSRIHGRLPHIDRHLVLEDVPKYFLLAVLMLLGVALFFISWPFLPTLIISAVVATGFYPLHVRIKKAFHYKTFAASFSTVLVVIIILVPIAWFVVHITEQAINIYEYLGPKVSTLLDVRFLPEHIEGSRLGILIERFSNIIPITTADIVEFVTSVVQNVSQFLVNQTTSFARSLSLFALHIIVFVLSLFFFLRDGEQVITVCRDLLPLPDRYRKDMINKLHDMSHGILYGVFGASMIQGLLAGVGFVFAGIENAAFWGTMMAFASVVPYIGGSIIWLPAGITLLLTGHVIAGIFLLAWCVFLVSTIDNVLKPLIIGEKAHIHPLLSFIAILGGIYTMGLPGIIIAPYVLSLALSFLYIYRNEYERVLRQQ